MTANSEPATWRILTTNGGLFQWVATVEDTGFRSEEPPKTLAVAADENPRSHLSSMDDILLQYAQSSYSYAKKPFFDQHVAVPSKLGGFGGDSVGNSGATFFTALGRTLSVQKNSIQKARSLLEGEEVADKGCGGSDCFPMFRTGLGKSVQVSHSSIKKAEALLEVTNCKEGNTVCNDALPDPCVHAVQGTLSTFPPLKLNTAGGRSISISSGALTHARSLLNDSSCKFSEHPMDQHDASILTEQKKVENELLMDINHRIGKEFGGDHIAALQNFPHVQFKGFSLPGISSRKDALPGHSTHELHDTGSTFPPLKFNTAAGRSISVSADALKQARSLLNELELDAFGNDSKANEFTCSTFKNEKFSNKAPFNLKSISVDISHDGSSMNKNVSEIPSSVKPIAYPKQLCSSIIVPTSHCAVLNQVHVNECSQQDASHSSNNFNFSKFPSEDIHIAHREVPCSRKIPRTRPARGPLVDISNCNGLSFTNKSRFIAEKRRPGEFNSSSSFKRPRSSRFTAPLKSSSPTLAETAADLLSTSVNCCTRKRVFTRYPFQIRRKNLKEFFGGPPGRFTMLEHLPDRVRYMTADNAGKFSFCDTSCNDFGPEAFQDMLLMSGASLLYTNKKWVANHYKWIVWKLACLERCYSPVYIGRLLTVSNVLEELKYRYEREFNNGHRSALKKILDGDVSSSTMMVLCVSAIRSCSDLDANEMLGSSNLHEDRKKLICDESNHAVKIELTDGWYSLNATLDVHLSKQLIAGKLFVGQKLRVWGATLCGWVGPISPLEESSMVSLFLHINGTYRAHWAESLGFCKGLGAPLAFRCIKVGGGKVPRTFVGITRLYPILYKERLQDGSSIVRSENMEKKVLQFYSQRRSDIAEDIISEIEDAQVNVNDSEEGSKILKILESSSEPEVLMAGLSSEQLNIFSNYQSKQEALRQANLHKKIEKALEEAGLGSRDVTPFMRVRVIGLISTGSSQKDRPRGGWITIWNPTEKQKLDLVEGHMYSVSGLTPLGGSSDFLYLQSRGCYSSWNLLSAKDSKKFEPFFIPRKSVLLSNLGEVPLASEFDVAAVVVHVGEVHISGCQRTQWIFVTDGSACNSSSLTEDQHNVLLAISYRLPLFGNDSLAPISQCLSGNTVGFCNLIKRAKDWNKNIWVAEATENSTYSVFHSISCESHLKEAANSTMTWGKSSSLAILKLKERILRMTGGCGI